MPSRWLSRHPGTARTLNTCSVFSTCRCQGAPPVTTSRSSICTCVPRFDTLLPHPVGCPTRGNTGQGASVTPPARVLLRLVPLPWPVGIKFPLFIHNADTRSPVLPVWLSIPQTMGCVPVSTRHGCLKQLLPVAPCPCRPALQCRHIVCYYSHYNLMLSQRDVLCTRCG